MPNLIVRSFKVGGETRETLRPVKKFSASTITAVGRVNVADSLGSIGGGVLFSFVLISFLDHFMLLCVPAFLNLLVGSVLAARLASRPVAGTGIVLCAVLVGMEFPLVNRVEFAGAAATASTLYTADFVGACLGALLASAWLIPTLGIANTCWIAAGLNVGAALLVLLRKIKS